MFTPTSAITGAAAGGSAWRQTTRRGRTPIPRAVRTKSCCSVSRSCDEHIRVHAAASGVATIRAGSQRPCTKPTGSSAGAR